MPQRTFDIDCSPETAATELPMPPSEIFKVGSFHPLMANAGSVVLCMHDETDKAIGAMSVSKAAVEAFEGHDDEFLAHLERVLNAEAN